MITILAIINLVLLVSLALLASALNKIKKQLPKRDEKGRFTK